MPGGRASAGGRLSSRPARVRRPPPRSRAGGPRDPPGGRAESARFAGPAAVLGAGLGWGTGRGPSGRVAQGPAELVLVGAPACPAAAPACSADSVCRPGSPVLMEAPLGAGVFLPTFLRCTLPHPRGLGTFKEGTETLGPPRTYCSSEQQAAAWWLGFHPGAFFMPSPASGHEWLGDGEHGDPGDATGSCPPRGLLCPCQVMPVSTFIPAGKEASPHPVLGFELSVQPLGTPFVRERLSAWQPHLVRC